jgi:hypothetical protein
MGTPWWLSRLTKEPGLCHPDHRDAELGVRVRAQAGPAAGVQVGVAVDNQQAQTAQIVQDRAQRREFAQVELARPVGGTQGMTAVRSACTQAKVASAARMAAARTPPVPR